MNLVKIQWSVVIVQKDSKMKIKLILTTAITLMFNSLLLAESVVINSGTEKNQLVELYTSEGCSSCPPADRWISKLKDDSRLWSDIFPVAFHVDYWDRLGWKDELASQVYSQRQRLYREEGGVSQVYTPGFVVDGQEWRGFFKRKNLTEPKVIEAGELAAEVSGEDISVHFNPLIKTSDALLIHIAILGFEISNQIEAGENRGKTLTHDFVVLGYDAHKAQTTENKFNLSMKLPKTNVQVDKKAIVVWVSDLDSQSPLQVAGNWL